MDKLDSGWAFIIYLGLMFAAFILSHLWKDLPYLAFASNITIGVGAYWAKRYTKDKMIYQNGGDPYADNKAGN